MSETQTITIILMVVGSVGLVIYEYVSAWRRG